MVKNKDIGKHEGETDDSRYRCAHGAQATKELVAREGNHFWLFARGQGSWRRTDVKVKIGKAYFQRGRCQMQFTTHHVYTFAEISFPIELSRINSIFKMQALRRCPNFCRSYATQPPLPELARVARTKSAPLAVRLRRRKQFGATPEGKSDSTEAGLTPTEQARYTRLNAQGALPNGQTEEKWLAKLNARRSRVRGFIRKEKGDITETEVLGRRIYLPNILLRLVRNNTPPGQPYNPYEATFRIPQSVTKTDVRSLLQAIYGVKVTYIRTDNYISPWYRTVNGFERRSYKTYKRAVVGLVDPFYYPHRLEDMPADKRKEREEWIEKHFSIQHTRNLQKEELLRMTRGQGRMSWKFNAPYATKKSHIIRLVAERRAKREGLVNDFAGGMRELREGGETIDYAKLKAKVLKTTIPPSDIPSPPSAPVE